jgi:DNA-binding FadR family transcriptional regulator
MTSSSIPVGSGLAVAQATSRGAPESAAQIRELIVSGEYQPGDKLPPERELATLLGVSRGAVREAISELAALNIVHARQGAGTFVSSLDSERLMAPLDFALLVDPDSSIHLYEFRRILEPVSAAMAAVRISPARLTALGDLMAEYDASYERSDVQSMIELDEAIHLAVAVASGNPLLAAVLRSVAGAAHRARLVTSSLPTTPPLSHLELSALVKAIEARDPFRAEAAMTRHVARLEDAAREVAQAPETS